MTRTRICVIAFKDVRRTIHVLRQVDYLSREFDLTLIGHGQADPAWRNVDFRSVPEIRGRSRVMRYGAYAAGHLYGGAYPAWYAVAPEPRAMLGHALASRADVFHANDLIALPIAVEAARRAGGKVVFHAHEYAPLEREDRLAWRILVKPAVEALLRRYTTDPAVPIAATITVCEPIAERYRDEWGLDPVLVSYNAPKPVPVPETPPNDGGRVRLIHHGFAKRDRGLDKLVEAVGLAGERFTLDFMLVEDDPGYTGELRQLAARHAPGRVNFRPPVEPGEIVRTVAAYTMGLPVIEPSTYNNLMMLPNKFFEYVQAGLALCVGPSPAMVALVERYGMGVSAPSFEPRAVAATLSALTPERIAAMRRAARAAAGVLNADIEMGKIVEMYRRLLTSANAVNKASSATRATSDSVPVHQ